MQARIRIAVIDDHPMFRDGVAHILKSAKCFELVGEGSSRADAVEIAKTKRPDVMLLDISMPGGGIEATSDIVGLASGIRIILLTVSEEEEHVSASLQAGAFGYVLKGTSGPELNKIIQSIFNNQSYVSPGLAARLLSQSNLSAKAKAVDATTQLTAREDQILADVSRGRTNKEIANALNLSEKTVKHYMTSIMQKLNVRNRVEAVLMLKRSSGK